MQRRYRSAQDVHAHFCLRVDFRDGIIEEGGFAVEGFVDAEEAEDGDWAQAVLSMCKQLVAKGEEALTFRREGGSVGLHQTDRESEDDLELSRGRHLEVMDYQGWDD